MTQSGIRSAAELARALYHDAFADTPAAAASAPGRVNLIGEHLDYNGGPVLPVAVERRTAVVAGPADRWTLVSSMDGKLASLDPAAPMGSGWTDYVSGVVRELGAIGSLPAPARIAVASTVPIGAGLSSSAALTVATAAALSDLAGGRLTADRLADVAFRAEHDQVGVRCGRMDQTIAAHARAGTALLFDTATGQLSRTPMPSEFWIVETGMSHRLTGGELNSRRQECEHALALLQRRWAGLHHLAEIEMGALGAAEAAVGGGVLAKRLRHVVTETARTRLAARALAAHDIAALGALLLAGHESLRDAFESTVPEADSIVESAMRHGAFGARLTGAGWGGAVVLLAPPGSGDEIIARVTSDFTKRHGRAPSAWSSRAAAGVRFEAVE